MNKNYSRAELDALGIFPLRTLARDLGIKSPTSQNKEALIESILKVCSGEFKPEPSADTGKRRGRPPLKHAVNGAAQAAEPVRSSEQSSESAEPIPGGYPICDSKARGDEAKPYQPETRQEKPTYQPDQQERPAYRPRVQQDGERPQYRPRSYGSDRENPQYGQNQYRQQGSDGQPYRQSPYRQQESDGQSRPDYRAQEQERPYRENLRYHRTERGGYGLSDGAAARGYVEEEKEGVLEIHNEGYGFVRVSNYEQTDNRDAYISGQMIKRMGLRKGDFVRGLTKKNADDNAMYSILTVNGVKLEELGRRVLFEDLTPIYPDKRFNLETANSRMDIAIRSIDLIAPIGKGQRGMIVSPPKAGKTTILKKIANSISENHPDAHLIVLLIDERPEEVTDMQRSTKGEVVFSTFDENPEHHTRAAELVLARAKRLVEMGKDVVILMDSLTRLARAYNLVVPPTGRTLSGGIDPGALTPPKKFFGSARNIENGGSLTIIATALIDTGSRMDEVIYEEFKGTGNMEIHLDRRLSEKRIFPAIDLNRSSTRREELLLSQKELEGIWSIRKIFSIGDTAEAAEQLINMMMKTRNNLEFIDSLQSWLKSIQYTK
ncbi:MAG: transcription termination factor Rho [Firmicutes bacterium]|nr:transcription termination factor Rho [Bacillota bacterium]